MQVKNKEDMCFVTDRGRISGCTVTGPRSNNEDSIDHGIIDGFYILAIADGVGGAPYGEVASKMGTSTFIKVAMGLLEEKMHPYEVLVRAVHAANEDVCDKQMNSPKTHGEMCCTFIGAIVDDKQVYLVHVGDSRAYVVSRNNKEVPIYQITTDHNLFEQWKKGDMTYYDTNACGEMLCRVLGDRSLMPDYFVVPLESTDMLVLCTDGVSNVLSIDEIGEVLLMPDARGCIAEYLVNAIDDRRSVDNTTALVYCASSSESTDR